MKTDYFPPMGEAKVVMSKHIDAKSKFFPGWGLCHVTNGRLIRGQRLPRRDLSRRDSMVLGPGEDSWKSCPSGMRFPS